MVGPRGHHLTDVRHTAAYQRDRLALIGQPCWMCGASSTTADHVPPLAEWQLDHPGRPWEGRLMPACAPCNYRAGSKIRAQVARRRATETQRGTRWA